MQANGLHRIDEEVEVSTWSVLPFTLGVSNGLYIHVFLSPCHSFRAFSDKNRVFQAHQPRCRNGKTRPAWLLSVARTHTQYALSASVLPSLFSYIIVPMENKHAAAAHNLPNPAWCVHWVQAARVLSRCRMDNPTSAFLLCRGRKRGRYNNSIFFE